MILGFSWSSVGQGTISACFGVDALVYAVAAIGLNVQFGYTGLLNFGQAGFMACGAYGLGMTAHYFQVSFWWGILFGLVYAIVLGVIMGVPTLRLRADYLAIVTIALAEVIRLIVRSVRFKTLFGGSDGINGFAERYRDLSPYSSGADYSLSIGDANAIQVVLILISCTVVGVLIGRRTAHWMHSKWPSIEIRPGWIVASIVVTGLLVAATTQVKFESLALWTVTVGWVVVALLALFVYLLMRSPWGRVLKAIREDEDAVRSLGKNVYNYKMQALILGGVIATFAGMLLSLDRGSVQPDNYSRDVTFYVLTALVLGGAAKVSGSIVGPMIFWGLLQFVNVVLNELVAANNGKLWIIIESPSQIGPVRFMLVGVLLILLMVFRPQGLFGNRKEMALDGR